VYGTLVTVTGWTLDYIRQHVTMADYNMLVDYWAQYPPTHILVGSYLGVIKERTPELTWETESIESLFSRWNEATSGQ